MSLTYIPPVLQDGKIVVQLEDEDIATETEKWKLALIAYVVGNTPSISVSENLCQKYSFTMTDTLLFVSLVQLIEMQSRSLGFTPCSIDPSY